MQAAVGFDEVKLVWRPAPHQGRFVVGTLRREGNSFRFTYDGLDLAKAREVGFEGYPGMGRFDREYNGQAMSSFVSRLPSRERTDFGRLARAWGGDPAMDDFELLGSTGGRLPTDMFEFVPVLPAVPGVAFVTDLAGARFYEGSEEFRSLTEGTALELEQEPDNSFDSHAVKVLCDGKKVANIKRVHCDSVFEALANGLQVSCKLLRVRMNGAIHEVIVRIEYR